MSPHAPPADVPAMSRVCEGAPCWDAAGSDGLLTAGVLVVTVVTLKLGTMTVTLGILLRADISDRWSDIALRLR